MSNEEYQKLDKYLLLCSSYLSDHEDFLMANLSNIIDLNTKFISITKKYKLEENYQENKLTFQQVYNLAREIIGNISKDYLNDFDNLINSGELDFDYEQQLRDSNFRCTFTNNQKFPEINIRRNFNYTDVVTLVHEFMHYTNGKENRTFNRYILTEFISIYYEMYATEYLIKKGINIEEINYKERIVSLLKYHSNVFDKYAKILVAYLNNGKINDEIIDKEIEILLMKKENNNERNNLEEKYNKEEIKKQFVEDCKYCLENFEKQEKEYNQEIRYEKEYDIDELSEKLAKMATINYRYIFGTLMAIYARKNSDIRFIDLLNKSVNKCDDFFTLFDIADINLNDEKFDKDLVDSVEEYINCIETLSDEKKVIK